MGCVGSKDSSKEKKANAEARKQHEAGAKDAAHDSHEQESTHHSSSHGTSGSSGGSKGAAEDAPATPHAAEAASEKDAAAAFTVAVAEADAREVHSEGPVDASAHGATAPTSDVPSATVTEGDAAKVDEVKDGEAPAAVLIVAADAEAVAPAASAPMEEDGSEPSAPAPAAAAAEAEEVPKELEEAAAGGAGATIPGEAGSQGVAGPLCKDSVSGDQQGAQIAQGQEGYRGPGPATDFAIEDVFGCFDEGNGMLFRVVNNRRHMWAFYNDTEEYVMHVAVVFGNESMVRPLGKTTQRMMNEKTGQCQLDVVVQPGETEPFMRGEYNGFTTSYDAIPTSMEEENELIAAEPAAETQ